MTEPERIDGRAVRQSFEAKLPSGHVLYGYDAEWLCRGFKGVAALREELARTEGDLGVAIREAAAAREALKAVDALLSGAERIAAAIGRDYTGEGVEAWVRGEDLRPVIDAALDQRPTQ